MPKVIGSGSRKVDAQQRPQSVSTPSPETPQSGAWTPKERTDRKPSAIAVDASRLMPVKPLVRLDPFTALEAVKDGAVSIDIPLRPGSYKLNNVSFTVAPGTVARVYAEVRDGEVVAARNAKGKPTGGGTRVEVTPPLDLPGWITGEGLYVKKGKGAQVALNADLGGFVDLRLRSSGAKLTDVLKALAEPAKPKTEDAGKGNGLRGPKLLDQVLDVQGASFRGEVSFAQGPLEAGSMRLDLAEGTRLSVSGNLKKAELSGQVAVAGLAIDQEGLAASLGKGSAKLQVSYAAGADGALKISAKATELSARVERLETSKPRFAGDTDPDRLSLGASELRGGTIELESTQAPSASGKPATSSTARVELEANGTLVASKLTVKDSRDDAELRLVGGQYSGKLRLSPEGNQFDLKLDRTAVEVRDLQAWSKDATLSLKQARAEGNVRLRTDGRDRSFELEADAHSIDVKIDDLRGKSEGTSVDLGSSRVTGSGKLRLGKEGAFVEGGLRLQAKIDDLKTGSKARSIDVAAGSSADLRVAKLGVSASQGLSLDARGKLDVKLDRAFLSGDGVDAATTGRLRGEVSMKIDGKGAALELDDAKISANATLRKGNLEGPAGTPSTQKLTGPTVLSPKLVESSTPAQLVGVGPLSTPSKLDPLAVARRLKSGQIELELPIEGRVGKGPFLSVDFPPGTMVRLTAEVADGALVKGKLKVAVSQPGDAIAWVKLEGAYLDEDRTLRVRLSGAPDFAVPGMEKLPVDFSDFIDRIDKDSVRAAAGGVSKEESAERRKSLRLEVRNAEFLEGLIPLPGIELKTTAGTRVSISHSEKELTIRGPVAFSSLALDQKNFALGAGSGTAKLELRSSNTAETRTFDLQLRDLSMDTRYAVQRRANGDYLQLAQGRVEGGSLSMQLAKGQDGVPSKTVLELPRFEGEIAGGRVTVPDKDGTATAEFGRARVKGSVMVRPDEIQLHAQVERVEIGIKDLAMDSAKTSVDLEEGRAVTSGTIDFATGQGLSVTAEAQAFELDANSLNAGGGALSAITGPTRVRGSGKVQLKSDGELSINGKIELDSQVKTLKLSHLAVSKSKKTFAGS